MTNEAGLTIEQYDYVLGPLTASNYPATVSTLLAPPRNTTILRSGRYNLEAGETNSIPTLERLGTDYICLSFLIHTFRAELKINREMRQPASSRQFHPNATSYHLPC